MNTRKMASKEVPKGVATIKNVMKQPPQTPYYLAKQLERIAGGKRKTRKAKKSRKGSKTRKH